MRCVIEFLADGYVDDVLAGRVVVGEWVKRACERHVDDLAYGHLRGLFFDREAAKLMIAFVSTLQHWKGEWAGEFVRLEGWQQFFLWCVFGWMKEDGTRRFSTAYLEVARKNGKTTLAAGVGLGLLLVDGEPGAEIYSAATKLDQARISHESATRMARRSALLSEYLTFYKDNIHVLDTSSKFEPLGRDADTLDGLNVHAAICDEVHAWKTGQMWDILETGTGSRRQPLLIAITTAGSDRSSFCFELHDYGERVLSGVVEDDSFFSLIFSLDRGDDWTDQGVWAKANPNLGVSKKLDNMVALANRAGSMPARLSAFKKFHLNMWVQGFDRWVDLGTWRACGGLPGAEFDVSRGGWRLGDGRVVFPGRDGAVVREYVEEVLGGRRCWGALDLSSTLDFTAFVLVFEPLAYGEPFWVVPRFWIPEDNVEERVRNHRVPVDFWVEAGFVVATPGDVVDYDWIEEGIRGDAEIFGIEEICFDPWNATSVSNHLIEDGFEMIAFRQGFASMSPAMKSLEVSIRKGRIGHLGNPVLSWMAGNLIAVSDPAGNVKPDKKRSREKIDGMVALIMGHYRAMVAGEGKGSVYKRRGLRVL